MIMIVSIEISPRLERVPMASGDPQRVWFPEMLARLRCEWDSQMSFPALIELRDRLDAMLQQIRLSVLEHRAPFGDSPPLHPRRGGRDIPHPGGEFRVQVANDIRRYGPGTVLLGPKGVPHTIASSRLQVAAL
jgi:hypothetical protein